MYATANHNPASESTHCVAMTAGMPAVSWISGKMKVPTTAPSLPAAADSPWNVERTCAGKAMAGTTKDAMLAPLRKHVHVWAAAQREQQHGRAQPAQPRPTHPLIAGARTARR